jgi:hypothetical protein
MAKKTRYFLVIESYRSPYPSPIIFHAGEQVRIRKEFTEDPEWKNWMWCEGKRGNKSWVPKQYLEMETVSRGVFLTEYNALELSVRSGEVLKVHEIVNGFAMAEKSDGRLGWVPLKNLNEIRERER